MPHLLLRGVPLGPPGWEIKAVLFDKDGTISHSEPMLEALARERLRQCRFLADVADLSGAARWAHPPRRPRA